MRSLTSPAALARASGATAPLAPAIVQGLAPTHDEVEAVGQELTRTQLEALVEVLGRALRRCAIVVRDGAVERRNLGELAREYREADLGDVAAAIHTSKLDPGEVRRVIEGEAVGPRIVAVTASALRARLTRGLDELADIGA